MSIPEQQLSYRLRRRLGRIKSLVVDQWPYRSAIQRARGLREDYRARLDSLPPIPRTGTSVQEVHMLCGHRDLDMGIWASWSALRFFEGRARLVVHSDGTLDSADEERWRGVVGDVQVIARDEHDAVVAASLRSVAPRLYAWRCSNWASKQFVDMHFFGSTRQMLLMDSDVLVFHRPREVIDALHSPYPRFAWCDDLRDAYSASRELIHAVTGIHVPPRFCAGFLVTPRLTLDDFMFVDELMGRIARDGRIPLDHFWSCQTYFALVAARYRHAAPLPAAYANSSGPTASEATLRHYVGIPKVRFRYFTEGLPRLLGA